MTKYKSFERRFRSFFHLKNGVKQKLTYFSLAEYGYFHNKKSNAINCFNCEHEFNKELSFWKNIKNHRSSKYKCAYAENINNNLSPTTIITKNFKIDTVKIVRKIKSGTITKLTKYGLPLSHILQIIINNQINNNSKSITELLKDVYKIQDERIRKSTNNALSVDIDNKKCCIICLENERNIVFMPCKHLMCCYECSVNFTKCPTCREKIKKIINIYT